MMKIKYITQEALNIFKNNPETVEKLLKDSIDRNWIKGFLPNDSLKESRIEVNNLDFFYEKGMRESELDFINARMIHQALSGINETQAAEEALWVGLSLTDGFDFMIKRWGVNKTKVKYRWQLFVKGKRGLIHHGIARLWWFAHMTYDPSREEPYALTEFAFMHQSFLVKLAYRNYSNSSKIVHAIFDSMIDLEARGYKITYDHTIELYKEISLLGSISIIDVYSSSELIGIITKKLRKIIESKE